MISLVDAKQQEWIEAQAAKKNPRGWTLVRSDWLSRLCAAFQKMHAAWAASAGVIERDELVLAEYRKEVRRLHAVGKHRDELAELLGKAQWNEVQQMWFISPMMVELEPRPEVRSSWKEALGRLSR